MSGAELALAIVPLVLILIEHHPTVWRKTKVGWSSKSKNDQQLDFFQELHAELSLLHVTLDRVKSVSNARDAEEPLAEQIDSALGKNAPHFQQILDRVMRSVNDLVREKSSALRQNDIVGAATARFERRWLSCTERSIRYAEQAAAIASHAHDQDECDDAP
jgi:hypothetical protein